MSSDSHIQNMMVALADGKPPYCAGTKPLPDESFLLYYAKSEADGESAKRIDLSKATTAQLEDLTASCLPATFGVDEQDVYDENYRRAGKLDSANFATKIDLEHSSLIDAIRYDLLEGLHGSRPIWAELYKLNVYGKDCFFKTHKDTPRSEDMFGSLVIVFPTPHEGGALLLSYNDRKWTFDSAKLLSTTKESSVDQHSHIAYIAFFSDVDHEVSKVESGHRVTITYNLHFTDQAPQSDAVSVLPPIEAMFKRAMEDALVDSEFLPEGGYLGFGFSHEYPIETGPERPTTDKVQLIKRYLKGRDAIIRRVCTELGLNAQVMLEYMLTRDYCKTGWSEILGNIELGCEREQVPHVLEPDVYLAGYVREEYPDSLVVDCKDESDIKVLWVTEPRNYNRVTVHYLTMGYQPRMNCVYGKFFFLVKVGKFGERRTA